MKQFKTAIVENDEDERFFMVEAFKAGGFDVVGEFGNGDQILEWLSSTSNAKPELIITDLNMPGKNGYDIISEIASAHSDIKVIATSTSSMPVTRQRCLALGAWEFLPKPDIFTEYDEYVGQVRVLLDVV